MLSGLSRADGGFEPGGTVKGDALPFRACVHRLPGILNGSISTVARDGDGWDVLSVNGLPLAMVPIPVDERPADGDTATR